MAGKDRDVDNDLQDEDGEEGKSVGGKKKLIIILILVIFLGGAGAGAWFMGLIPGVSKPGAESEDTASEDEPADSAAESETPASDGKKSEKKSDKKGPPDTAGAKPVIAGQPVFYELPEFLVNLNTGGKQVSFLKMTVTLELADEKGLASIEANLPKIMDACNSYLRELRSHEVSGSAGFQRLKEELLARINKTVEPTQVKSVLFNNIIQQ